MADDVTYTSTNPAGLPDSTKQATDEHATRGHMPLVKLAYSADGDATPVTVDANGVKVNASGVAVPVTDNASTLSVDDGAGTLTVDAPVGTPVFVRLSDGAAAITALPVTDNASSLTIDAAAASTHIDVAQWNGTTAVTGSGTATGALRVELPTNGTGVVGLNAGTNAIGKLAANSGVDIGDVDVTTVGTITPGTAATSLGKAEDAGHTTGDVGVMALAVRTDTLASESGTNKDYNPIQTNSIGAQWVQCAPATTGGLSINNNIDIDETEDAIKASAGQLYTIYAYNNGASTVYMKLYNDTVAGVSVGTTVPVMTFAIPGGSAFSHTTDTGWAFSAAITVAATTGVATADTGAPAANQVVGVFGYA